VGEYGICSGYAFFGIQGEIDWGDGTTSAADYRDYQGADNAKVYGSHLYERARPEPYSLCGRFTSATCDNNGHLYSVNPNLCCCAQRGAVYVYISIPVKDVNFGGVTDVPPNAPPPIGVVELTSAVPGKTGSLARVFTSDATIASPSPSEVIINPQVATGTFSVVRGGKPGAVTFSVESGGVTVSRVLTFL
jgi:hypothetical protein